MKLRVSPAWLRAPTHDDLQSQARQYLELRGWLVIDTHDDKHRPAEDGVSDHIAMRRGRNLLLEYKVGRDKLRPSQIDFSDRAIRCGLEVHEVRTLDDVIRIEQQAEEGSR
ncbi:MAG: hypothetical protein PHS14_10510 [Elusimicrobia bacterium]|nr:hypothetical protein [Elusimicrobiota bacterium]